MNYWENATEFYPNNSDYDVWDNTGGGSQIGSIQGLNVRHHHFPSNRNPEMKSIIGSDCDSDFSEGVSS